VFRLLVLISSRIYTVMAFDGSREPLHEKNIEAQLLNQRKTRPKFGQVYPLEYTKELLDL